jgi:hypothetical protein
MIFNSISSKHLMTKGQTVFLRSAMLFLVCGFFSMISYAQLTVDYVVVGGGGGGGFSTGGGGGGGQVKMGSVSLSGGTFSVTIGNGGTGATSGSSSSNGQTTTLSLPTPIISIGGGGGGSGTAGASGAANGGGGGVPSKSGGTAVSGGFAGGGGGNGLANASGRGAGGGGGAGGQGEDGYDGSDGGIGLSSSITGTLRYFGGGGGGGFWWSGANSAQWTGNGGNGGGGRGGKNLSPLAESGAANTGGGGGGSGTSGETSTVRNGGSGIVIVRYASTVALATGGTITSYTGNGTNGTNGVVYQVHTFTASGSFSYNPVIATHPSTTVQNICLNGTSTTLTVTAIGSSPTYQWYSNTINSNSGGTLISGQTTASYTPSTTVAGQTYYYCYVSSSNGNQTSNVSGAIVISNPSVSGSISGANTVTSGTNSTVLSLSGHTGSVQWQSSTNGTSFSNINSATNATYTATNLTTTTYYQAVITSGSCASVTTSSVTILVVAAPTAATTLSITGTGSQLSVVNNTATVVDAGLVVTSNGVISGFSVTISENYTSGDILDYTGTLPSGVDAAAFNTVSRSLVFSGSATAANWQALLRTVRIKTTSVTCNPESRKVVFSASTNLFNYFNGHYYEVIPASMSWTNSKAYAASKSFFGRQGYLVTINSSTENAYVYALVNQNSWIGCSDNYLQINAAVGYTKYANQNLSEGKWHWITGPEKGIQMRTGNASTAEKPGSPISGVYQNWNSTGGTSYSSNEPNDVWSTGTPGEEDYGHITASTGKWNDFKNNNRGLIIEYGGMPGDNPVNTLSFTRSITVSGSISGNISGGNVTVCPSVPVTLTLNGASASVLRWESSPDNFLIAGNIQTIANTSSTLTLSSLVETQYYRCILFSGGCTMGTNSQPVFVSEVFAGGVTANTNQICVNSNTQLTVNGYTGSVQKWQFTTNISSPATDIVSTASVLSHTQSSAGTYYYRCVIGNASCSASTMNTDWYPITVVSGGAPIGGQVSTNYHCGVNNVGVIELSGATGGSYQWQISSDGGNNWSNVPSATTQTLAYQNITSNRKYRVLVSNGACGSSYSSIGAVELYGTTVCQWTGAINSTWTNAGNWCAGIIADEGRAMDVSATAANEPVLDANRTISTLRFNSGSKKVVLGNFNLTTSQILGGDSLNYVQTSGTGSLRASIAGAGGSFNFAAGKSTFNPVTITNNSGSNDFFTVRVSDAIQNCTFLSSAKYVNRTWDIGKATANGESGISFLFNWYENQVVNGPVLNPILNHYGTNWATAAGTSAAGAGSPVLSMTHTGYTGTFSPFAISDQSTPLPVSMSYFNLTCAEEDVKVNWQTASEHNSDYFQLETSINGVQWEIEQTLPAAGFSQELLNYSTVDQDAARKQKYYRLKQIDLNGEYEMYGPLKADCAVESFDVSLYPNPCESQVTVSVASQISTKLNYTLISPEGKVLENKQIAIQSGMTQYTLDVSEYQSGMYMLQFDINDKRLIKKLTVQ